MNVLKQTNVILKKNFLCTIRNKGEVLRELLVPLISGLVIYSTSNNIILYLPPININFLYKSIY